MALKKNNADLDLPYSMQEISQVIGREPTIRLVAALPQCGSRKWRRCLYVPTPARMRPDHIIMRILGPVDAYRLASKFGGIGLQIANGTSVDADARNARIIAANDNGSPYDEIALEAKLSIVSVRRIVRQSMRQRKAAAR